MKFKKLLEETEVGRTDEDGNEFCSICESNYNRELN